MWIVTVILLMALIGTAFWTAEKEAETNHKVDELIDRIKVLTLIAHIEFEYPDECTTTEFKIIFLEKKIRDLEYSLLNHSYQKNSKSDTQQL